MDDLTLYIPRPEDGWFYVKMMTDPATMAYNAPWFPPDGRIPDPEGGWKRLTEGWIGKEPDRFYAFLRRKSDGAFVGDVNFHRAADEDRWDMGIVIYAPERGKGYGKEGLRLLLARAFLWDGVPCLRNDFEAERAAAYRIHQAAGFREKGITDGIVRLELTRKEYFSSLSGDASGRGAAPAPCDRADRDHMRELLRKASPLIDRIAADQIPFGSPLSAKLIDMLAAAIGHDNEKGKDEDALGELRDDRYTLINLYGAVKKIPAFLPLYKQLVPVLRRYGLFDEEAALLESAAANASFAEEDLIWIRDMLRRAAACRDAFDAARTYAERLTEALREKPLDPPRIEELLDGCGDDRVLYAAACDTDKDRAMVAVRGRAARLIRGRDYRYALSSHVLVPARISMILDQFDSLKGDALFIARTILTDPYDPDKTHMLLYCEDEALLMLGWRHVYGARSTCTDRLRAMGSPFPEKFMNASPDEKALFEREWLSRAADIALGILDEDEAVRGRIEAPASVDSDPVYFFLSIHHPDRTVRLRCAEKLTHPARVAYVGSWTPDDEIKEALSVKIGSKAAVTEMLFGDLSGADLVFAFRKPEDLSLQDRFCVQIMKNHPDRAIREHVRAELLRGKVDIPGVDLEKPDPFY